MNLDILEKKMVQIVRSKNFFWCSIFIPAISVCLVILLDYCFFDFMNTYKKFMACLFYASILFSYIIGLVGVPFLKTFLIKKILYSLLFSLFYVFYLVILAVCFLIYSLNQSGISPD